jgi:hypothetical protein
VLLRVTAAGSIGSGPVTLSSGGWVINSDVNLTYNTNPIAVTGAGASQIDVSRLGTSMTGRTITLGSVSLGGAAGAGAPVLGASVANSYNVNFAGINVQPSGATLNFSGSAGGGNFNGNGLALGGNLTLSVAGSVYNTGSISGAGAITRTFNSGTLVFNAAAAPGFTGSLFTSGGTTEFRAANSFNGGRLTLAGGSYNVTTANALFGASGTMTLGSLNLSAGSALAGMTLNLNFGTVFANVAGALGAGTAAALIDMTGGRLLLRTDAPSAYGGNVSVSGTAPSLLSLDRLSGAGAGGQHSVSTLTLNGQRLNLAGANGYGLTVPGGTTVNPGDSVLSNDTPLFVTPSLQLNGNLTVIGFGDFQIGSLGGAGEFAKAGTGVLNLTQPALPGFTGKVFVDAGTLNLNAVAGALSGGAISVEGGVLNVGVPGGLAGVTSSMLTGFLNANVTNALAGTDLEVINGTLNAAAPQSFGTNTVHLLGGNLTATAPDALGPMTLNIDGGILALRNDAPTAFGGNVTVSGTNFAAISVAPISDGPTGNTLSINSLTINSPQLNITGAHGYTLAVLGPVNVPAAGVTINATAADAVFAGPLSSAGPITKTGVHKVAFDGGGTTGAVNAAGGTLALNNAFGTGGITVGGAGTNVATLEIGGDGVNSIPAITINQGTLRITKAQPGAAIPAATPISGGANGDVTVEYAGLDPAGVLASNINMSLAGGARKLTVSAASVGTNGSTLVLAGQIAPTGPTALTVVARADTPLDDIGTLVRAPSRVVLASTLSIPEVQHGGGIVIAKGNVHASGVGPFGTTASPINLAQPNSTTGAMPGDGQNVSSFFKSVTTATNAPRQRLGAFHNPSGTPGVFHILNFNGTFAWNDPNVPIYAPLLPGSNVASPLTATWNGLFAESGAILNINNGAVLDNILTTSGGAVTSTAPIYAGGGGIVRLNSNFNPTRDIAAARGLAGAVSVLDDTTLENRSGSANLFETIELLSGTYRVAGVNQRLVAGLVVGPSPFDPSRTTSNVVTEFRLDVEGNNPGRQFRIGPGQTLVKSGADALNIKGAQLHGPGSTLVANQGSVNLSTDAGSGSQSNLSVSTAGGATVNLAVSQHLARVAVGPGSIKLAPGATAGAQLVEATDVTITGGQLDIANGRLIIDYAAGASPLLAVRGQIGSAYDPASPTHWTAPGITSSAAAADATTGIGYGEASAVIGPAGGAFGSEIVDDTSIVARWTKLGDASLDGRVDFVDLVRLAQNYGDASGTAVWTHGDFNYSGTVDFNDLVTLAQNYNSGLTAAPLPAFAATANFDEDLARAFAQVPEPGTLALLGIGACALSRRRRRS